MKNPKLIDIHTHVNFKGFKDDGDKVIKSALDKGIWLINVGSQYSTSKRAIEYANNYEKGVYAAVGLHPVHIAVDEKEKVSGREFEKFDPNKYYKLLRDKKVVAVGEIGLDYKGDDVTDKLKDKQKEVLMMQIELAQYSFKPIIFHCRKAYDDLIDLLTMFSYGCSHCPHACSSGIRGVIHSFMGRLTQAHKFLDMGLYISFNGLITYARDYDKVIKNIPLEKILLETDAPYLTPHPHRGERNEPRYVEYTAKKIAEIKGVSYEDVAQATTKNAMELFGIKSE